LYVFIQALHVSGFLPSVLSKRDFQRRNSKVVKGTRAFTQAQEESKSLTLEAIVMGILERGSNPRHAF
jgi:hypothetical protein